MVKRRSKVSFLLVILIFTLTYSHPVQADIAPPKAPAGSNIDSGDVITNVRMVAETVTIEIPSVSEHETGQATVTAVFQMRNLGDVDERMDVRFPLCSVDTVFKRLDMQGWYYFFPPVENFSVWVDGSSPPIYTTYESLSLGYGEKNIDLPCWANFPVIFPPGKDVTIKVQYIQVAGYGEIGHGTLNFVTLTYVLYTGAGWKDTIGSADIIARFPVDVENLNVWIEPREATIDGKAIHWHFENFEPDHEHEADPALVEITFLQPKYWYTIEQTREKVNAQPNDGEAWGQLGKAIKDAFSLERGFSGEEYYWESYDAYDKAVTLLPNDADWHYGFADLVCGNAWDWEPYLRNSTDSREPHRKCIEQLEQALKLNPNHQRANELLETLKLKGWIKVRGPDLVYLILTPDALTKTSQPTATNLTQKTPQTIAPISPTVSASTTPDWIPTSEPTILAPAKPEPKPSACAAIILPLIAVALLLFQRYRW